MRWLGALLNLGVGVTPTEKNKSKKNQALRRNSLANANGFTNETAKISSSLRKSLGNRNLQLNSLVIGNAMAWCTTKFGCRSHSHRKHKSKKNQALRRNSLANANGFTNEIAKNSSSLRKLLENRNLR